MMKVILLDDVEGVGKRGEAHDVRDGFGRNFLVPRGFAIPATRGNIKKVQEQAKVIVGKRDKDAETAEYVKRRLEEAPPVIIKKKGGGRREAFWLGDGEGLGRGGEKGA